MTPGAVNAAFAPQFDGYTLVMGEGPANAELMLIGEAPGAQEARTGRPFVGPAGKMLGAFLKGVGLQREELYIANAVKFRPTKPGTGRNPRERNRVPTRREIQAFRPWLLAEIDAVSPRVIATLGNSPLYALTGKPKAVIGDVHGRPLAWDGGPLLFPLYHPACILYRRELSEAYAEDLLRLREFLAATREG